MSPGKPPTRLQLTWLGELSFRIEAGSRSLVTDGDSREGLSPVELLAGALASCMAADVAHILMKGRHPLERLSATITGERAPDDPRRFVRVTLEFVVGGDLPLPQIERAIALSHEKYCSVWHSMRQDIELTVRARNA